MPVPTSFSDLDTVAANNSPQGTETAKGNIDNYLRSGFSFTKQLYTTKADLTALSASTGTSLIDHIASGTGAQATTVQAWMRHFVLVSDYRQTADPDDSLSFSRAIAALPAAGGRIIVPDAAYVLATQPTWGTKSIMWDIGPGATFSGAGTGAGKFPYMATNTAQLAVGPFIQSRSHEKSTDANGGIAAFNVEMLQPSDYGAGQSVAMYLGSSGSSTNPGANVWSLNALIRAEAGAAGTYQCLEIDVDCFSSGALVKGISINGMGTANPDVGIEIIRADSTQWGMGINVRNSIVGIQIESTGLDRGIVIGGVTGIANTLISGKQLVNGADSLVLQRNVDTAQTGYLMRGINAANSATLFSVDVSGNAVFSGIAQMNHVRLQGGALAASAGQFAIGSTNQATVGAAGTASALPATPRGYLIGYDAGTKIVIPYYNA